MKQRIEKFNVIPNVLETGETMRLICPNCSAEYEIPDDAIPEGGRDLQCSSCGITWFSKSDEIDPPRDVTPQTEPPQVGPKLTKQKATGFAGTTPKDTGGQMQSGAKPYPSGPSTALNTSPDLPKLDSAVADVLRQEAAVEVRRRSNDSAGGLETQPDLGLDALGSTATEQRHAHETRKRLSRMRGTPEQASALGSGLTISSPETNDSADLPDIEALNSSLRQTEGDVNMASLSSPAPAFYQQAGFFAGFLFVSSIAVVLALIYAQTSLITRIVPNLVEPLEYYQMAVDQARGWLNQQAAEAKHLLNDLYRKQTGQT
ncbi:MAG: zinc-ribbon domain-containing protein [Paracoccaceae bacterium]|nr:zinc-ribbon domain-containing protein [Paracoccaceae bacterium]